MSHKYIEKTKITSFDELSHIIQGKTDFCEDIRSKFIFRGIDNINYKLVPSSLRGNRLDDFVSEDFKVSLENSAETVINHNLIYNRNNRNISGGFGSSTINKYGRICEGEGINAYSPAEFQYLKEVNALMKFFENGDKVGLKIPTNQNIRDLFGHDENEKWHGFNWPEKEYFELISLAQHYGIPTRALDWSYDYKVSLYFAVKNIIKEGYLYNKKPEAGVLWAFNYKQLEIDNMDAKTPFAIKYYRPEYHSNPNLNAQKGLFTFIINKINDLTDKAFDEFIEELLCEGVIKLPENEKAFYKFEIPETAKPEILYDLYQESYSEEHLFPGYAGVTQSIENKVKLDTLLQNQSKKDVVISLTNDAFDKIAKGEKKMIFTIFPFKGDVDKIFIYIAKIKRIVAYTRCEIYENTPVYFWDKFSKESGLSKEEFFKDLNCLKTIYALKIVDFKKIKQEIPLNDFEFKKDYYFLDEVPQLKSLVNRDFN